MAKELVAFSFDDSIVEQQNNAKGVISQVALPQRSIEGYEYKLSDLAKLDKKSNLGLKLLKPRNPDAKRGSQFDILLVNQTNLIVRREWVAKSWLLVIIPEKLIYKIFNEQTGACLYDPGKAFMDRLSDEYFDDAARLLKDDTGWLTEEENAYAGQMPNAATIYKFFQNINSSNIMHEIYDSPLLYGKELFMQTRCEWDDAKRRYRYHHKFRGLPFKINTLLERQIACLYFKCPNVLNKTSKYVINQDITLDQMKISLKLVQDFPTYVKYIQSLENKRITSWPDETPITDINKLRTIFKNIDVADYYGSASSALDAAINQYVFNVDKFDEFRDYLREYEYVSLNKSHYFDILIKAKALNNGVLKNKYPTHWLTYERKVNALYDKHARFIKGQKKFVYPDHIDTLEHITSIDNKDYDYQIVLPRTYGEILEEGEQMHHCVGGYADGIYNGDRLVLFLRKKSKPDKSFGTIDFQWDDKADIKTYRIHQCKGRGNTDLPMDAISYIDKYIKLKKLAGINEHYARRAIEDGDVARWDEEQIRLKEEAKKEKEAKQEAAANKGQ